MVTTAYYPFVYLPVAASLRGMDPALEETARALGQNFWAVLWRVVLPQLRPALLGGMLLVALNSLVEFGAFALLRFRTFTTAIYGAYRTGFSGSEPALLAMVLLLLCILCLTAEALVRGTSRYGRLARGTNGRHCAMSWGAGGSPPWPVPAGLGLLTTFVPLATICYWMTQPGDAATTAAGVSALGLLSAGWSSVSLGIDAAILALALALPLGLLAARYQGIAGDAAGALRLSGAGHARHCRGAGADFAERARSAPALPEPDFC